MMELREFITEYNANLIKEVYNESKIPENALIRPNYFKSRKKMLIDIFEKFGDRFINAMSKGKRVIVVYHGVDIDGLGIRVISEILEKIGGFRDVLYVPCDKRADEAWDQISSQIYDYDLCIIADLNFTDEFVAKIYGNLDTKDIILLDHHKHALGLNKESWAYVNEHNIYDWNLSSGTMLLYTLLEPYIAYTLANRVDYDGDMKMDLLKQLEEFVTSTAAHDTWFAHDFKTADLSMELFDKMPLYLSMIHKTYKEKYVGKLVENILYSYKLIDGNDMIMCKTTNDLIQNQCTFMWHNCKIHDCWITKDKISKIAVCYVTQYTSEIGNYILKKQKEIDFVVMINPNVNSISLRSRTDEFDVSEIVKKLDGGGHQAASGFTIPNQHFFNNITKDIINLLIDGPNKLKIQMIYNLYPIKDYDFDKENNVYILDELSHIKHPKNS